LKESI